MKNLLLALWVMLPTWTWAASDVFGTGGGSIDTAANAFIGKVGILNSDDKSRINGFVTDLRAAGLWTNLVDACFLRTNLQPLATQPTTLFSRLGTNIGSPSWTSEGVGPLNGTSQAIRFTVPACTNFTLIVVYRTGTNVPAGSPATLFSFSLPGGTTNSGQGVAWNPASFGVQGQSFSGNGTQWERNNAAPFAEGNPGQSITIGDWRQRTVSLTFSNPSSMFVSAEGWQGTAYANGAPTATNLTELCFGARMWGTNAYTDFHNPVIIAWALFNTPLTQPQCGNAFRALRWQDPQPENVVAYGDSLTAIRTSGSTTNIGWFYNSYGTSGSPDGRAQYYDEGLNGQAALNLLNSSTNAIFPKRPGGPVKKATLHFWAGINDLQNIAPGDPTNSLIQGVAAISNMWYLARSWGFYIEGSTITPIGTNAYQAYFSRAWTNGLEWARLEMNRWIIAHSYMVDRLHRRDLMFLANDTNLVHSLDGIHFSAQGNSRIAAEQVYTSTEDFMSKYSVTMWPSQVNWVAAGTAKNTAGNGDGFNIMDVITVPVAGGGAVIGAIVPSWVTQAVSYASFVWHTNLVEAPSNTLFFSNACAPVWFTNNTSIGAGFQFGASYTVEKPWVSLFRNGMNLLAQPVTLGEWPTNMNIPRAVVLRFGSTRSNTAPLALTRWRIDFYGTPGLDQY